MKEYIAKTGGRYTYNDDLLNLQELARSMTSIFEGCSNFIISGCEVADGRITPGYVWIGGRVRPFEGAAEVSLPYYIYEKNHYETIAYAGDVNKHGRCCYLCSGATSVPQTEDEVTGALPGYIELREDYAPRFIDKFIGRYAVLLESPFARQTVHKDLTLAGSVSVEKQFECKTGFSVVSPDGSYSLQGLVRDSGAAEVSLCHQEQPVSRVEIATDGSFTLYGQDETPLVRVSGEGVHIPHLTAVSGRLGALHIEGGDLFNTADNTDEGTVSVNRRGYRGAEDRYRNFAVYDGRNSVPLLLAEGRTGTVAVAGGFEVRSAAGGITLRNTLYDKKEAALQNLLQWQDKEGVRIAWLGYGNGESVHLNLHNDLGGLTLSARSWVDVASELRIAGRPIAELYVSQASFTQALAAKVNAVEGKGLSTEDFTTEYRRKLDAIVAGSLMEGSAGFATTEDVSRALGGKLNCADNLADLADKAAARNVLGVYSSSECDGRFLQTKNFLAEFASLTAAEVEGKSPEEIIALKQERQQRARENLDAERRGTGDMKLSKASNLADVEDKDKARHNINVYSIEEVDALLAGKLDNDAAYQGAVFTTEHKAKLEAIRTGTFAGRDESGGQQNQSEGYVTTSSVVRELSKYAPRLMAGYNTQDKATVAANLELYTRNESDGRFATLGQSLQDYVSYLVRQGKATVEARKALRGVLAAAGVDDLIAYVRRDQNLADLTFKDDNARRLACQNIGAAYAPEYEKKITDTGWLECGGENAGTLWARQIGNIVCVQGIINTALRSSNNWGSIATIPNVISPPRFGCRQTMANFNDDHVYNRGCSFVIKAGSRTILMHESGAYNVTTELSFSYMT